jgi:hypothetical protein
MNVPSEAMKPTKIYELDICSHAGDCIVSYLMKYLLHSVEVDSLRQFALFNYSGAMVGMKVEISKIHRKRGEGLVGALTTC